MTAPTNTESPFELSALTIQEYESLFHEYYQWLCLQAFRITDDWHTSEDIVQEFFINCWQKRSDIVIRESWKAFASRSVKNATFNYLKKEGRRIKHEATAGTADAESDVIRMDMPVTNTEENYLRVLNVVNNMPEQRRKVFLLSIDKKYSEIATELDISINTVKMHLKLAYQELRNILTLLLIFLNFF